MSTAVDLKDPSTFPSRRVEAWKYTDLRRFLRETPPPSAPDDVAPGGPFAALGGAETAIVNGRGDAAIRVVEGEQVARLRFVSTQAGAGHQATVTVDVVVKRQEQNRRWMVHLLNMDEKNGLIKDVKIKVKPPYAAKAVYYAYPDRHEVDFVARDGMVEFVVRQFDVHEMIVVEWEP